MHVINKVLAGLWAGVASFQSRINIVVFIATVPLLALDFYYSRESWPMIATNVAISVIFVFVLGQIAWRTQARSNANQQLQQEIPGHKQAEEALRESAERYRTLFESTREGIVISGADGRILSVNPAAAAMFGYARAEELVGVPGIELYQDQNQRNELFAELKEKGYATDRELSFKKKDGVTVYIRGSATIHLDQNGDILETEGIFTDITERKRAGRGRNPAGQRRMGAHL